MTRPASSALAMSSLLQSWRAAGGQRDRYAQHNPRPCSERMRHLMLADRLAALRNPSAPSMARVDPRRGGASKFPWKKSCLIRGAAAKQMIASSRDAH